jgi:hypothetical protein
VGHAEVKSVRGAFAAAPACPGRVSAVRFGNVIGSHGTARLPLAAGRQWHRQPVHCEGFRAGCRQSAMPAIEPWWAMRMQQRMVHVQDGQAPPRARTASGAAKSAAMARIA